MRARSMGSPFLHLFSEEEDCGVEAAEDVHGIAVEGYRFQRSRFVRLGVSGPVTGPDEGLFPRRLVFRRYVGSLNDGHGASPRKVLIGVFWRVGEHYTRCPSPVR